MNSLPRCWRPTALGMTLLSEQPRRRVLVTGGSGFIGRPIVDRLLAAGHAVTVATHDRSARSDASLEVIDLRDQAATEALVDGHDWVLHLAARQGGIQFQERPDEQIFLDNVGITGNVLRAAGSTGVARILLASSAVVYSASADSPIAESAPLLDPRSEPVSPYAWSKISDEVAGRWALDRGVDVVGVRFTNVYGPGAPLDESSSTVVHALVRRAIELAPSEPLLVWGDGTAERSFVHVEDAADAVVAVMSRGETGRIYNISTTGRVTIGELAQTIRELAAPDAELRFDPSAPGGHPSRVLDHTALDGLGVVPRYDLRAGLLTVVEDARRRLGA